MASQSARGGQLSGSSSSDEAGNPPSSSAGAGAEAAAAAAESGVGRDEAAQAAARTSRPIEAAAKVRPFPCRFKIAFRIFGWTCPIQSSPVSGQSLDASIAPAGGLQHERRWTPYE